MTPTVLNQLEVLVKQSLELQQYQTACFWADKLVCLGDSQCHFACSEIEQALDLLLAIDQPANNSSPPPPPSTPGAKLAALVIGGSDRSSGQRRRTSSNWPEASSDDAQLLGLDVDKLRSSVALLKGRLYEAQENRILSAQCYHEALQLDATCFEAFEQLINFQALTPDEETNQQQLTVPIPPDLVKLETNVDHWINKASRLLNQCRLHECHDLTSAKATQLDRRFGPAWLSLGHAFAADGEHDQAIASYCTAAQVIHGSHIPIMYIGMEYAASNNRNLAERFLLEALQSDPNDPFVLNELGKLSFDAQRYSAAKFYLLKAYNQACALSGHLPSTYWEPLVNNLGHTYRKLGMLDSALKMHQQALYWRPDSTSTRTSLGLVHALQGNLHEAVAQLHHALSLADSPSLSGSSESPDNAAAAAAVVDRRRKGGSGGQVNDSTSNFATTLLAYCIDLLVVGGGPNAPAGDKNSSSGPVQPTAISHSAILAYPPSQSQPDTMSLPPPGVGSVPSSHRVKFTTTPSRSAISAADKVDSLQLDITYRPASANDNDLGPSETTADMDADGDVSMELC